MQVKGLHLMKSIFTRIQNIEKAKLLEAWVLNTTDAMEEDEDGDEDGLIQVMQEDQQKTALRLLKLMFTKLRHTAMGRIVRVWKAPLISLLNSLINEMFFNVSQGDRIFTAMKTL